MKRGTTTITKVMRGTTTINKVYRGTTLIWENWVLNTGFYNHKAHNRKRIH